MGFYLAAQLAPILLATTAIWFIVNRASSSSSHAAAASNTSFENLASGGAIAATLGSGAVFLGLVSALTNLGYDGLVFPLGLIAGLLCASLLWPEPASAEPPAQSKAPAVPALNVFSDPWGSIGLARFAAAIACVCLFLLLTAELKAASVVVRWLVPSFSTYLFVALTAAVALTLTLIMGLRFLERAQTVGLALLLLVMTIFVGFLAWTHYGAPVPQLSFGYALSEITTLEQTMVETERADPGELRAHVRPNIHFDAINFFAIIFCVMCGVAAITTVLLRAHAREQVRSLRRTKVWTTIFLLGLAVTIPAVAAFTKLELYRAVTAGLTQTQLPDWIMRQSNGGVLETCATRPGGDANAIGTCDEGRSHLALQDLKFEQDALPLLAQEIAGSPTWAVIGVSALLLITMILNASGIARVVLSLTNKETPTENAVDANNMLDQRDKNASRFTNLAGPMIFLSAIFITAYVAAMTLTTDILTLVAGSLSLAAAGLFPILLFARFWPQINPLAVTIGAAVGVCLCAYYIVAATFFAPTFVEHWSALSNAPPWQLEQLEVLKTECQTAGAQACALTNASAKELANWWGIEKYAAAIFSLPLTIVITVLLAFVIPHRARTA